MRDVAGRWNSGPPHLRKTALIIQNPQYPMRLRGYEVDAGLVVTKSDVLPWDLFSVVLLLHGDQVLVLNSCELQIERI